MSSLTTFYNNENLNNNENTYLYFKLGESKYAIKVQNVVEIMKLPSLDYPQKLSSGAIGLLQYNNFTISILDLRFYLNTKISPYNLSNQLLIVKTDETIFGFIIDKAEDIFVLDSSKIEHFSTSEEKKIIEFLYKKENDSISIINLNLIENILREGSFSVDVDIPSLFPQDEASKFELETRSFNLQNKINTNLVLNIFSQDKFTTFSLNDNIYCLSLKYVKEFLKNVSITKIPCNLNYIEGVVSLKGDFITVINLSNFLGESSNSNLQTSNEKDINTNNIIIVEYSDYKIGILVDEFFEMIDVSEDLIKQNPQNSNKYILNEVLIENKFYTILNIKNILSDEKLFIEEG